MNDIPKNKLGALIAAAQRPVVDWKPEKPGDLVVGEVIDLDTIETKHGPALCVTVLNEEQNTEYRIMAFHDRMKRPFRKVPPEIGDLLAIQYGGKVHGPENDFYDYKVVLHDASGTPKVESNGKPAAPDLVDDADASDQASEADRSVQPTDDDEAPF